MQGAEDEGEGSVLTYVTEPEFRKQRSRSPSCNSLIRGSKVWVGIVYHQSFGANAPPTWGLGSVGPPAEVLYLALKKGARLVRLVR